MSVRFIHTADWQLSKPFANFPPALAGELAAARLAVIRRIAAIARDRRAPYVLVAGDVFDGEGIAAVELRRALAHFNTEADLTWILLPGNHDPARAGGLWERIAEIGLPANVRPCLKPEPFWLGDGAVVLPAPLTSKAPGHDPTAWMMSAATPEGLARIGLAHGSVQGFGSEGESSVEIARDRAMAAGLDYLALGDWHGTKSIDARTWYAGTPEPDRFPDNEPGHVLAVSVSAGGPPEVQRIASATFTWAKVAAAVRSAGEFAALEERILAFGPDPQRLIVRLSLTGALTLSEMSDLNRWRERLEGRVRHLEDHESGLALHVGSNDLAIFGADGALRAAAERLALIARDEANPEKAIAKLALQRLAAFAAEAQGAGS